MKIIKNNYKFAILTILTFISIFPYFNMYITNNILKYIMYGIFILSLFIFYKKCYKNIILSKPLNIVVFIISIIWVLGYSYEISSTSNLFWNNILLSIIKILGYYYFIKTLVFYFHKFLTYKFKNSENKILKIFESHPFLFSFIFSLFCYSIFLINYYPGIINYDNANQIKEVLGIHTRYLDAIIPISNSTLTNFNPIIHTLLLGGCVKFGISLGSFNFGLFLYTFFQEIIVILIYSYVINYAVKNKINPLYSFIILLILGLIPLFGFYSITAVKDTLYTAFLLLFSLKIYDISHKKEITMKDYISLFIISLVILFRNNGIFIVILTLPFLLYKEKKLKLLTTILLILISSISFNNILLPSLGISGTSIRETLSVPFQQTARLKKVKKNAYSKSEAEIISKILDYDNLEKDYNEDLADPVKNKFNKYYKSEDLKLYFEVWFKHLFKEPGIYIDATINNITGYFYPFENSWKVYHKLNHKLVDAGYEYHYNKLDKGREFLHNYEIFVECSPLGLILNIAIITWLSIIIFVMLCNKNRYYIFLIPNIISILFCILSPANTYYRYIYPSLVMLIALFPIIKNIMEKN